MGDYLGSNQVVALVVAASAMVIEMVTLAVALGMAMSLAMISAMAFRTKRRKTRSPRKEKPRQMEKKAYYRSILLRLSSGPLHRTSATESLLQTPSAAAAAACQ